MPVGAAPKPLGRYRAVRSAGWGKVGPGARTAEGRLSRPLRALHGPNNRPEKDLDLDLFQIAILKFHHMVKAFLANRPLGLLKSLVMTLDDCPAYRTLALFITFHASFQAAR